MKHTNPDNYITFVCEAKGCTNIKTQYKCEYKSYKSHGCSKKCMGILRSARNLSVEKPIPLTIKQRIDNYFKKGVKI